MCVGHTWGTVCDYGFYTNAARVLCRQLGYNVDNFGTCKFNKQSEVYNIDALWVYMQIHTSAMLSMDKAMDLFGCIIFIVLVMKRGFWNVGFHLLVITSVVIMRMLE